MSPLPHPCRYLLILALACPLCPPALAALSLSALHSPVESSFAGFSAPAVWASATPGSGQLDSTIWSMNSDGALATTPATFGGDQTGGGGTSTGSESATGVYAFDVGGGLTALGVQPTGTYWTPGMFTLRLRNDTDAPVTGLVVEWTGWVYNDQGRANDLRFLHSPDNSLYHATGPELDVLSPTDASPAPVAWQASPRSTTLSGLSLNPGAEYFLRWGGDDVAGSGSRDELALSGVRVTPIPEPATVGLLLLGALALGRSRR